jgi:hypothetical protein
MTTLQWQLVQGRGISSSLIGWFGGGGYSHIDVITPRGMLRGSRSDEVGGAPPGYEDRMRNYEDWTRQTIFTLSVTEQQASKYWEFSNRQLGKPYDKRGILGFATGQRDWHDEGQWFCSEEVCANGEYAGIWPGMFEACWRVDPGDMAFIFSALGAKRIEVIPIARLKD